jgi:hypothetical protein
MAYGGGATTGAAAHAAMVEAIKASGAIVQLESKDFMTVLSRTTDPLVIVAEGGVFKKHLQYLVGYKGFVFFTKSSTPLQFPGETEFVRAKKIWVPS